MSYFFNVNKLHNLSTFSPPHHTKTTDRKIIDESIGAKHFSLWHGEIEPGGMAELHAHKDMEQAFIVLEGEGAFKVADIEYRLGKGDIIFIPINQPHQITSVGDKV